MPTNQRDIAKQIILEIIRQGGGTFTRTTSLYKAFYFAHLYYAENAPDYLSEWPIVKMPHGPGIDSGADLLKELVNAGFLTRTMVGIGPYQASRYALTDKNWPGEKLSDIRIASIKSAADFVSQKTSTELSELTHEFSRSWNKAVEGQRLNCYIDLIPEEEYEERRSQIDEIKHRIAAMTRNTEAKQAS
jgi:hypothetical protein